MRKNMKIRMAVFLCIVMVLPSILSVLPMTATEVSAATDINLSWYYYVLNGNETIQVEQNQKFNIGDFVYIVDGSYMGCASLVKNVSYSSSKKTVAKVDTKGNVTTKNPGKTTITIKYKGKKITCKFKVVKAGTFGDSKAIKASRSASKKIQANIPTTITTANGYKCLQLKEDYGEEISKYSTAINDAGFLMESAGNAYSTYYTPSCKLAVPQAARINALNSLLQQYGRKNSPSSTTCSKVMKIKSISASTKQITVKVKDAVSKAQILGANIMDGVYNNKISQDSANFYVFVYDVTADRYCMGIGTMTKGSKTIIVKTVTYSYENGKNKLVTEKLKKGHTYILGNELYWGYGKKVKVK